MLPSAGRVKERSPNLFQVVKSEARRMEQMNKTPPKSKQNKHDNYKKIYDKSGSEKKMGKQGFTY